MSNRRQTLIMILAMTIMMGEILSAVFTWQATGFGSGFISAWMARFVSTYIIVLPTVLVVAPFAQQFAHWLDKRLDGGKSAATSPRNVALAAWRANGLGHGGGDFAPWLAALADDVRINMPLGPFRGETIGKGGAVRIYGAIAQAQPHIVYDEPLRISENGNTVVVEFDDHGTIGGMPYRNRIAASFDVKNGKIAAYREYFCDIDPSVVAMMTGAAA